MFFIPVSIAGEKCDAGEIADTILTYHKTCGFKRFALIMPGKGWRSISYPPRQYFEEKAELISQIKKLLPPEIRCGWWHTLTLKSGPTPGYQRIVRLNGTEAPFSTCPLDENFRNRFAGDVAYVLQKAHPDFFITEDDLSLNCHGGPGCFCKRHLEEFARREGRYYSREELESLFTAQAAESRELLRRWQDLSRDTLVLFARTIREEADKLTPEIPMGFMNPGICLKDGNCAESVARAFAGKKHIPFVRFHGTFYGGEQIADIPESLLHGIYSKEHIKGEFHFLHESDCYPHTRFFTSGGCMRALMSAIYSCGYDGSIFFPRSCTDFPEETAYISMYIKERERFNALHKCVKGCRLQGAKLHYDPFESCNFPQCRPEWLRVLFNFGIPFTTRDEADMVFVSGEQLRFMPDKELRKLLSGNIFLDGDAARVLTERNLTELTGVAVREGLLQGNARFDLGSKEIINDDFCPDLKGRTMARADMYCPRGTGFLHKLEICDPACEEVTRIVSSRNEYAAPGMTFFRNAAGGNVVTYATALEKHFGQSLFNYRRQALLQELLIRCGARFPMVRKAAKVFLIANEPQIPGDFKAFFTFINLAVDPLEEVSLYLPEHLRSFSEIRIMDRSGEWQQLPFEKTNDGVVLKTLFNYTDPVYITLA